MTHSFDTSWRPPHAYIPGKTPRHPEALFEPFKVGIADVSVEKLYLTSPWKMAHAFLAEEYFWEAHEIFEAIWMVCPPNSPEKLLVQALIQKANAELKFLMGMERATSRLRAESARLAKEAFVRGGEVILGISLAEWENSFMNSDE